MSGMTLRKLLAVVLTAAGLFSGASAEESGRRQTPLVRAVQQSRHAVVNIHTEKTAAEEKGARVFNPRPRKVTGMGTGIVLDERGYIVTNYHVIQDVDLVTVTLFNGSSYDAQVISYDRRQDLAIIRIEPDEPMQVLPIGTSSDLMVAENVYAVGNAFGYEDTVTSGIISALHRDVEVDEVQSYENLIQTDASINPGNSGGPLLNLDGEVIGINVAIRSGAQRIGFAIPIDDARRTIARLLSSEKLSGLSHGVVAEDVKTAEECKLVVRSVAAESPAQAAGLQPGDVITKVREITVLDGVDFERALLGEARGRSVDVVLLREGRTLTRQLQLDAVAPASPDVAAVEPRDKPEGQRVVVRPVSTQQKPETTAVDAPVPAVDAGFDRAWEVLGIRLRPLNETERLEVTGRSFPGARGPVRYNGGMKITSVRPDSVGASLLREGDVLLGLDGYETVSTGNLGFILGEGRVATLSGMKCQYYRKGSSPLEGLLHLNR
jgi:serine protease Do